MNWWCLLQRNKIDMSYLILVDKWYLYEMTAGLGWNPEGKQDRDIEATHRFWFKKQGGGEPVDGAESQLNKSIFFKGVAIFKYSGYAFLYPRSASWRAVRLCQQQNIRHSSVTQNKPALICRFQLLVHLLWQRIPTNTVAKLRPRRKEQISIQFHTG